jgi:hypothetical protein
MNPNSYKSKFGLTVKNKQLQPELLGLECVQ